MKYLTMYLTQLELAKELIIRNRANDARLALILIDNCIEIIFTIYIKEHAKKEDKINENNDFYEKLDFYSRKSKAISIKEASLIELSHFYRNQLYHSGELKISHEFNFVIPLILNIAIDLVCKVEKSGYVYEITENYDEYFRKYDSEIKGMTFAKKENIIKVFGQLRLEADFDKIQNKLISILYWLLDLLQDNLGLIKSFVKFKFPKIIEESIEYYELQIGPLRKKIKSELRKSASTITGVEDIEKEIIILSRSKKLDNFFREFHALERKLISLQDISSPLASYFDNIVQMQIDIMREK